MFGVVDVRYDVTRAPPRVSRLGASTRGQRSDDGTEPLSEGERRVGRDSDERPVGLVNSATDVESNGQGRTLESAGRGKAAARPATGNPLRETTGGLAIEGPSVSMNDRPISLRITGATPGRDVVLVAETTDSEGVPWRSEMVFEADGNGVVHLTTQAPKSGTYDGVAPMGWLWSMRARGDDPFSLSHETTGFEVALLASSSKATTFRRLTRRTVAPDVTVTRWIDASDVVGHYYRPSDDGPHPGVLVLHDASGIPNENVARSLASHGFAALAVKYFGAENSLPDRRSPIPLSYFEAAADWLRKRKEVIADSVGVVGKSQGGEGALLVGANFGWIGATVAYVPMTHAMWAMGSEREGDPDPGWEFEGTPIPHVSPPPADQRKRTDDGLLERRQTWETTFREADQRTLATTAIDVERIDAPVLLISGTDDQLVPSTSQCERAVARLRDAEFDYPYEHLAYESAGHRIGVPYTPTANRTRGEYFLNGGTAAGYARAEVDSWPTVLDYLNAGLRGPDGGN